MAKRPDETTPPEPPRSEPMRTDPPAQTWRETWRAWRQRRREAAAQYEAQAKQNAERVRAQNQTYTFSEWEFQRSGIRLVVTGIPQVRYAATAFRTMRLAVRFRG